MRGSKHIVNIFSISILVSIALFFISTMFFKFTKHKRYGMSQLILDTFLITFMGVIILWKEISASPTILIVVQLILSVLISIVIVYFFKLVNYIKNMFYTNVFYLSLIIFAVASLLFTSRINFNFIFYDLDYFLYFLFPILYIVSYEFVDFTVVENVEGDRHVENIGSDDFVPNITFFLFVLTVLSLSIMFGQVSKRMYFELIGFCILDISIDLLYSYRYVNEIIIAHEKEKNLELEVMVLKQIDSLTETNKKLNEEIVLDSLTGLYNIYSLYEKVDNLIKIEDIKFSLLSINIGEFKSVNNTYGHDIGDNLLFAIAAKLKANFGMPEIFLYRLEGDEFAILFMDNSDECIRKISKKLINIFTEPFVINNINLHLDFSSSIIRYPIDATATEEIIQRVNIAMTESKNLKNNKETMFFSNQLIKNIEKRNRFENHFREIAMEKEFAFYVHEIYDVNKDKNSYLKTELRSINSNFIDYEKAILDYAEQNGMLYKIVKWYLDLFLKVFSKEFVNQCGIEKVSISSPLSAATLINILPMAKTMFDRKGFPLSMIELEVKGDFLHEIYEYYPSTLLKLNSSSVSIVVKDFGVGYSSLANLKNCNVEKIVIGETLVSTLDTDTQDLMIVKSIVDISRGLRLKILVEGVERISQKILMEKVGCDYISGTYIYEPILIDDYYNQQKENYQ